MRQKWEKRKTHLPSLHLNAVYCVVAEMRKLYSLHAQGKEKLMGSLGTTMAKLAMLATGAVIGALLARLFDEALIKQAEERSMRDKNRYEQGLPPIQPDRQKE
jgi:hypothetical protein